MNLQGVNFKAEINPDDPNRCFVEYTSHGEVATGVSFAFPDYIKHRFHVGDRMVLPTAMIKKYIKENAPVFRKGAYLSVFYFTIFIFKSYATGMT